MNVSEVYTLAINEGLGDPKTSLAGVKHGLLAVADAFAKSSFEGALHLSGACRDVATNGSIENVKWTAGYVVGYLSAAVERP